VHRYELFRMRSRESRSSGISERVLPTTERGLGFVATRRPLTTRPGPFRAALEVRIDAFDEAAKASLVAFAEEAAPLDLALVTPESTLYVDGAKVLRSAAGLVLAVSGGLYDEPGDARSEWRTAFARERLANDAYVEVPAKQRFLRRKSFPR